MDTATKTAARAMTPSHGAHFLRKRAEFEETLEKSPDETRRRVSIAISPFRITDNIAEHAVCQLDKRPVACLSDLAGPGSSKANDLKGLRETLVS